jgi:hypothetical protein
LIGEADPEKPNDKMKKPPKEIDGAVVLCWAWSGDTPFFVMEDGGQGRKIFGLAICKYATSDVVYKFSCNYDWETENDTDWSSLEEAKAAKSGHLTLRLRSNGF